MRRSNQADKSKYRSFACSTPGVKRQVPLRFKLNMQESYPVCQQILYKIPVRVSTLNYSHWREPKSTLCTELFHSGSPPDSSTSKKSLPAFFLRAFHAPSGHPETMKTPGENRRVWAKRQRSPPELQSRGLEGPSAPQVRVVVCVGLGNLSQVTVRSNIAIALAPFPSKNCPEVSRRKII